MLSRLYEDVHVLGVFFNLILNVQNVTPFDVYWNCIQDVLWSYSKAVMSDQGRKT